MAKSMNRHKEPSAFASFYEVFYHVKDGTLDVWRLFKKCDTSDEAIAVANTFRRAKVLEVERREFYTVSPETSLSQPGLPLGRATGDPATEE